MSEESMEAFGRACAEQNSAAEILDGLEVDTDGEFFYIMDEAAFADCIDWDLTPLEWVGGLSLALLYKLAEPAQSWEEAEATARALKEWGIAVESKEDKNGFFHFGLVRGRRVLEQMAGAGPRIRIPDAPE
jgi:hypothetical protein